MARSRVPAVVLDKLLVEAVLCTQECGQCRVGPVVEIRPDQTGCNWNVSRIEGAHAGACLVAIAEFINSLRERFLLETPADMDPTLLTTWAMR